MSAPAHYRIRRHRFSAEIRRAVGRAARLDNWHGPLEALEHWVVIAAWVAGSLAAWRHLPPPAAALVYLLAVFFVGGRQRALAGVLHQACHGTLMANRRAATALGVALGGWPVLQSYTGYADSHLREHHGHLGHPARDPDYRQYQRYGLCGENRVREAVLRHLLRVATPRATLAYVAYLLRHRIWNGAEAPTERWVRVALMAAVAAGAAAEGVLGEVTAYWLVPLVTTQVWIGSVAELLEHYPLVDCAPPVDIHLSWNRRLNLAERLLLGEKKGEGYHLVHHLFPFAPLWRLEEVDRILLRDPEYAALPRLEGLLPGLRSIFRSLPAAPDRRRATSPARGAE